MAPNGWPMERDPPHRLNLSIGILPTCRGEEGKGGEGRGGEGRAEGKKGGKGRGKKSDVATKGSLF